MIALKTLFWLSAFVLVHVYAGYEWWLRVLARLQKEKPAVAAGEAPFLTVLLTVYNEAARLEPRVRNILACDYPRDRLEILVASDGSDDGSHALVERLAAGAPVRLFVSEGRVGKTETQNRALRVARGEIVVFSDAETMFTPGFLREISRPFADASVGMVTGALTLDAAQGAVGESQGLYWRHETRLRRLESSLGILAVGSGQAMAARRELLKPMDPTIGEDCIVPLDVVLQGRRVVHSDAALAVDRFETDPGRELRTRIRMTLRNWQGTWSRPALLNPLAFPGYAAALWSHKLLRWLSPYFVAAATVSLYLLRNESPLYRTLGILALLGYLGAGLGWLASRRGWRVPIAAQLYGFVLANLGFAAGVYKALSGERIVQYRSGALDTQASGAPRTAPIATALLVLGTLVYYLGYFNAGIDLDDEGFLLANAQSVLSGAWPVADFYAYPPLSYWLLGGFFAVLGESVLVERLMLMLLLVANVWLVFWCARRVLPGLWGFAVAALYAFAPGPWYKIFFILHLVLILAGTLYVLERPRPARALLLGLAIGAALISRVEAGVIGGAIAVAGLLLDRFDVARLRLAAVVVAAAALSVAVALAGYALAGKWQALLWALQRYYNLVGSANYVNALSGRADPFTLQKVLSGNREQLLYGMALATCVAVCLRQAWRYFTEPDPEGRELRAGVVAGFALASMAYTFFYVWNSRMLSSFPIVYIAVAMAVLVLHTALKRAHRPWLAHFAALFVFVLAARQVNAYAKSVDFYSGAYTARIADGMVVIDHPRLKGMRVYEFQAAAIRDLARATAGAARSDGLVPMSEATTMGYLSGLPNPTYYRLFISEFAPLDEQQRAIETFERLKIRFFVARRSQFMAGDGLGSNLAAYAPEIRRYLLDNYELRPLGTGFVLLERRKDR